MGKYSKKKKKTAHIYIWVNEYFTAETYFEVGGGAYSISTSELWDDL